MTEQGECFRIQTLFSPHNFFFAWKPMSVQYMKRSFCSRPLCSFSQLTFLPEPWTHSFAPETLLLRWRVDGAQALLVCSYSLMTAKREELPSKWKVMQNQEIKLEWQNVCIDQFGFIFGIFHWMSIMRTGAGMFMTQNGNSSSLLIKTTSAYYLKLKALHS